MVAAAEQEEVLFSAFVLSRYTSWVDNFCNHDELSYPFYAYMHSFINSVKSRFTLWFGVYIALLSDGKKQLILIFF